MGDLKYIVSGSKYVSYVDQKKNIKIANGGGPYFGISWCKDRLFVSDRNNNKGELIHIYNTKFEWLNTLKIKKVIDSHQILWHSNKLFITDTTSNGLVIFENNKFRFENWTSHKTDVNHINSITPLDIEHIIVCYANGKHPTDDSKLVKVNIHSFKHEELCVVGNKVHNFCGGYCCNSGGWGFNKT